MRFSPGQTIYKYELISQLGSGNFGEVWLARDAAIDRVVAIKLLFSAGLDPQLLVEAQNGCKYRHQNLVEIFYADIQPLIEDEFVTIIAQEFHQRGPITQQLNQGNFLPLKDVLKYTKDILYGLEYLHENNLLHNDIKPSNILISDSNSAILADYGISSTYTPGNGTIASQFYRIHCAPETQRTNLIHPQSDVYQVGCTMYRLLNGIGCIKDDYYRLNNVNLFNQQKEKGKIPKKK